MEAQVSWPQSRYLRGVTYSPELLVGQAEAECRSEMASSLASPPCPPCPSSSRGNFLHISLLHETSLWGLLARTPNYNSSHRLSRFGGAIFSRASARKQSHDFPKLEAGVSFWSL